MSYTAHNKHIGTMDALTRVDSSEPIRKIILSQASVVRTQPA